MENPIINRKKLRLEKLRGKNIIPNKSG